MGIVIHGRTAAVHADQSGLQRLKTFLFPCPGVIEPEFHGTNFLAKDFLPLFSPQMLAPFFPAPVGHYPLTLGPLSKKVFTNELFVEPTQAQLISSSLFLAKTRSYGFPAFPCDSLRVRSSTREAKRSMRSQWVPAQYTLEHPGQSRNSL